MKTRFGDINIVGNVENKGSVIGPQEFALTVTVGTNGDFPTINSALTELSRKYPVYKLGGFNVEVKLLSGYVMNEYVYVNGVDMSWITITGEDAETTIVRSVIPQHLGAFRGDNGAFLPRIGQLFNMDSSGVGTSRHGVRSSNNSRVMILWNSGVKNAGGYGLYVHNVSFAEANNTIFTGANQTGILAQHGSSVSATSVNVSHSGSGGVIADRASMISADNVIATGCGYGIYANSGSIINAQSATATGAGIHGIYASNSSMIMASNSNARIGVSDSTNDIRVITCSCITITGGTGGVSQTANTYTQNGCIRK